MPVISNDAMTKNQFFHIRTCIGGALNHNLSDSICVTFLAK